MGKRGPIPKSNEQRKLEGNPSKGPPQGQSPIPADLVDCPDWLSPEAKREWARVAPELSRLGLLTKLDMAMLAGFCVSCSSVATVSRSPDNTRHDLCVSQGKT